jgi:hypothetical protein
MIRVGDQIVERFPLFNPSNGARITSGASFSVLAHDAAGTDISSQITVTSDGVASGIYTFSFSPLLEGTYVVSIVESTSNQQITGTYNVGGSVADHIMALANQNQTVSLANGGGSGTYNGTITLAGVPQAGVQVRAYNTQDPLVGGLDTSAVTDLSSVVATATTDINGHFILYLSLTYFTLQYFINNVSYQTYIRWSTRLSAWVVSTSPVPTSAL